MNNQPNTPSTPPAGSTFPGRLIFIGVATRIFIDTSVQIFFPYLGFIAQGINASEQLLSRLVGLRALTGLLSPVFGNIADRRGYRLVMSLGLLSGGVGYLIVGLSRSWPMMAVGLFLAGIGTFAFVPNLSAYLSGQLPFQWRARGLGMVEYAWALAGIVGLSGIGWLIEWTSWRVPFFILGAILIVASALYQLLPATKGAARRERPSTGRWWVSDFFDLGANARSAWVVMIGGLCIGIAGFSLLLVHGIWLQSTFGLSAGELGGVAFVLGFSDLVGSGLVSLIGDRLGKRRSVLLGAAAAVVGFLTLPVISVTLTTAVVGIFIARSSFEFALVGNIILLSEQAPEQRGKVLTLGSAIGLLGSVLASFFAIDLYQAFGITAIGIVGAAALLLAIALVGLMGRESADG